MQKNQSVRILILECEFIMKKPSKSIWWFGVIGLFLFILENNPIAGEFLSLCSLDTLKNPAKVPSWFSAYEAQGGLII